MWIQSVEVASSDSQALVENEECAAGRSVEDGTKEEKALIQEGTSPSLSERKFHDAPANTDTNKRGSSIGD